MSSVNLSLLEAASVHESPFPYLIVPGFLSGDVLAAVQRDFPSIDKPGSFPLPSLKFGPAFARVMADIQGPDMTRIIGQKFKMDLTGRPTMVTVRGRTRRTDGKIHTDSKTKLVTVLIYMNGSWEAPGGRLRLLNSPDNLDDVLEEIPPTQGTLLAFKNTENAWHGHEAFEGERRAIQLNWVRDRGVVWREQARHSVSAFLKRLKGR
jgi:SM-20-related protein